MSATQKRHQKECAHSGQPLDAVSVNYPLCICDPDGSKRAAQEATLERLNRRNVLMQDKVWYPKDGDPVRLDEMSLRWKKNLLAFLDRRASALHESAVNAVIFGPRPGGDAACDAFDSMFDELMETRPTTWLYDQPLVVRLEQLIRENHDGPVDRFDSTKLVAQ